MPELHTSLSPSKLSPFINFGLDSGVPPVINDWDHQWISEQKATCSWQKFDQGYLLRFPDNNDFFISLDGKTIYCNCTANTPIEDIRHLLLDQVLPRVLSGRGRFMLHGSAIESTYGVIVMTGESGMGKSTLAASFHQNGYPILTDDCMWLKSKDEMIECIPTYPSLRLWPESISRLYQDRVELSPVAHYCSKRRVLLTQHHPQQSNQVAAIFALESSPDNQADQILINQISPSQAALKLIENSFRLDMFDKSESTNIFQHAADIARKVPLYEITYPRHFSQLPKVHAAIVDLLYE